MWKKLINYVVLAFGCILITSLICKQCYSVSGISESESSFLKKEIDSLKRIIVNSDEQIKKLKSEIKIDEQIIDSLKTRKSEIIIKRIKDRETINSYSSDSLELYIKNQLKNYE